MARFHNGLCLITLILLPKLSCPNNIDIRAEPVAEGCFSSSQPLINQGYYKYQSSGHCNTICTQKQFAVLGLSNGTLCFCGNELPPTGTEVAASRCSTPCQGYNLEDCGGGTSYFTVWLTGISQNVAHYNPNDGSSTSTSSQSQGSTATRSIEQPTQSTSPSNTATASGSNSASASGSNTGSGNDEKLIIGLSVGLGVPAIIGLGVIFWCCLLRRRKSASRSVQEINGSGGTTHETTEQARQGIQSTGGPTAQMTERSQGIGGPPYTSSNPPSALLTSTHRQYNQTMSHDRPYSTGEQAPIPVDGSDIPPSSSQRRAQGQDDFDFGFRPVDDSVGDHDLRAGYHGSSHSYMYIHDIGESDSTEVVYSSNYT